jgi:hypothetical protein
MQNLVHALADIAAALPDLLEDIQGQLLDLMALILSGEAQGSCAGQRQGKPEGEGVCLFRLEGWGSAVTMLQ